MEREERGGGQRSFKPYPPFIWMRKVRSLPEKIDESWPGPGGDLVNAELCPSEMMTQTLISHSDIDVKESEH